MSDLKRYVSPRVDSTEYHIFGAYTRYSSWTARVVTVLEHFQIPYCATFINLFPNAEYALVHNPSPSGFVPVLTCKALGEDTAINDSLSICEFLAESHPSLPLWPRDRELRALARSAVAEMHSGFGELRNTYPTNFIAKYEGKIPITEKAVKEIERLLKLWSDSRARTIRKSKEGGMEDKGFLFGEFGIVDAFFWPILWRFRTYNFPLISASPEALAWMKIMWGDSVLNGLAADYFLQAENPETGIGKYDDIFKANPEVTYGRFEKSWKFSTPS